MPVLAASTFDVGTQIDGVVASITTNMETVATKAIGLVSSAAPYIIGVVAVGVILAFGIRMVKYFKRG